MFTLLVANIRSLYVITFVSVRYFCRVAVNYLVYLYRFSIEKNVRGKCELD